MSSFFAAALPRRGRADVAATVLGASLFPLAGREGSSLAAAAAAVLLPPRPLDLFGGGASSSSSSSSASSPDGTGSERAESSSSTGSTGFWDTFPVAAALRLADFGGEGSASCSSSGASSSMASESPGSDTAEEAPASSSSSSSSPLPFSYSHSATPVNISRSSSEESRSVYAEAVFLLRPLRRRSASLTAGETDRAILAFFGFALGLATAGAFFLGATLSLGSFTTLGFLAAEPLSARSSAVLRF